MKFVFIEWTRPGIYTCGTVKENLVRLIPGMNKIRLEIYEQAKNNSGWKKRVKDGFIKVLKDGDDSIPEKAKVEKVVEGDDAEILASFNGSDAIALVKETFDWEQLKSWKKAETRKTVLKAIEEQIELLTTSDEGAKEDDE